jgi:Protein of unknown function (DUF3987)
MADRFTEKYLEYAKEFTDCPDVFLMWGALLAISASLSRRVYVEIGAWNQSPNLWIVLIGKSSSHKSTAISRVEDLIESIDLDRLAPAEFSHEAIIDALSKNATRLFIFDEAKSFFDSMHKKYNEGLNALLTTLYRKPNYSRTTMKHGTINIQNAYLAMGMATTPEWLRASLQDAEQSAMSGFLSRFLMIPYSETENTPYPKPPPHDLMKFGILKDMLRAFQRIEQPFVYTSEADSAFNEWFTAITRRENKALPMLGGFFEHFKNEAIHKLSVIMAIDRGEREITLSAFEEAVTCLHYVEKMLPTLVQDLTDDKIERSRRKIVTYMESHAVCSRETLANDVHIHGESLSRFLAGLEADGLIASTKRKTKTRTLTMIEWTGGTHENGDAGLSVRQLQDSPRMVDTLNE